MKLATGDCVECTGVILSAAAEAGPWRGNAGIDSKRGRPGVYHVKLNDCDRRAIAAYQNACRAGWSEESCRFMASLIVGDEQRLSRILYQAKVSDPVAFRPSATTMDAAVRSVG